MHKVKDNLFIMNIEFGILIGESIMVLCFYKLISWDDVIKRCLQNPLVMLKIFFKDLRPSL